MTIQFYLPDYDAASVWLAENPVAWAVFGAVAWYWSAGVLINWFFKPKGEERMGAFVGWVASPLVVPLVTAVCTASVVLWPLSGGIVQPAWRWKESS